MVCLADQQDTLVNIRLIREQSEEWEMLSKEVRTMFLGAFMETACITEEKDKIWLLIGLGKGEEVTPLTIMEACARAAREVKKRKLKEAAVQCEWPAAAFGPAILREITKGLLLGLYDFSCREEKQEDICFYLRGVQADAEAEGYVMEARAVSEGIRFARDMVNMPGNMLRPMDFARSICEFLDGTGVETEQLVAAQIKNLGMNGLAGIGSSSEFPPCLLIIRYKGSPDSSEVLGLAGKGVTCDTGGYCLKSAGSMTGIKGDMAGGAAVAGAIYALAKNKVRVNVTGLIPMCENRISKSSLLPGDVITSFSGKTIEILNTDAEGRLILADTAAYAVQREGVTRLLDIATLTGAVVSMLGFSIAGVMADDEKLWAMFERAYKQSGEKYWRLPFGKEHEKMIESKIADIKNMGESHCGTITAGLFIRAFAGGLPWIHLDIAGTAWVDTPLYEYQTKGATGAGTSTLYYLCKEAGQL